MLLRSGRTPRLACRRHDRSSRSPCRRRAGGRRRCRRRRGSHRLIRAASISRSGAAAARASGARREGTGSGNLANRAARSRSEIRRACRSTVPRLHERRADGRTAAAVEGRDDARQEEGIGSSDVGAGKCHQLRLGECGLRENRRCVLTHGCGLLLSSCDDSQSTDAAPGRAAPARVRRVPRAAVPGRVMSAAMRSRSFASGSMRRVATSRIARERVPSSALVSSRARIDPSGRQLVDRAGLHHVEHQGGAAPPAPLAMNACTSSSLHTLTITSRTTAASASVSRASPPHRFGGTGRRAGPARPATISSDQPG